MIAGALGRVPPRPDRSGATTFGKGCAQEYLDDDAHAGVLRLTTLLYALPDGTPVQRVGLAPTLRFPFAGGRRERPRGDARRTRLRTWRGPDVRDRAVLAHADDGTWSRRVATARGGNVGPCKDADVCRALRLLGSTPATARRVPHRQGALSPHLPLAVHGEAVGGRGSGARAARQIAQHVERQRRDHVARREARAPGPLRTARCGSSASPEIASTTSAIFTPPEPRTSTSAARTTRSPTMPARASSSAPARRRRRATAGTRARRRACRCRRCAASPTSSPAAIAAAMRSRSHASPPRAPTTSLRDAHDVARRSMTRDTAASCGPRRDAADEAEAAGCEPAVQLLEQRRRRRGRPRSSRPRPRARLATPSDSAGPNVMSGLGWKPDE